MPKQEKSSKSRNLGIQRARKYKKPSVLTRGKVIAYYEDGKSQRAISDIVGLSRTTVQSIIKLFKKTSDIQRCAGSGNKRKTTKREDNLIRRMSKQYPFMSAQKLSENIALDHNVVISHDTVDRRLKEAGLYAYVSRKKPFISAINIKKRLEWCIAHQSWNVDDWKRVLWCDESPFTMSYHGRVFVRRPKGKAYSKKYIKPTFKHSGGKIQVWGCFSANGVGDLHKIDGIMVCTFVYFDPKKYVLKKHFFIVINITHKLSYTYSLFTCVCICDKDQEKYRQILIHHAMPSGNRLLGNGFIFVHDNDPKHTAGRVKTYLNRKQQNGNISIMNWPSQSPDLNPIEHLWNIVKMKRKGFKATSRDNLFQRITEIWQSIPVETLKKLVESMPERVQAVIKAKGGHTKY